MFKKPFKSSGVLVVDNTLKSTLFVLILFITNLAVILSKIRDLNFNLDVNIIVFGGIFVFVIITVIINMIKWNITYMSYKDKKITVYKNIVIKNKCEFCINNISSIIMEESFIDKIFKVCRLKIYTYGMNNYLSDFEIVYNKEKCIKLRDEIINDLNYTLDHKLEDKEYDIKINFKNILLHSFFNIPFTQIFVIINAILIIFFSISNSSDLKEIISNLLGILITVLGIILPVLYNFINSIITFYGLKIDRNGDFLHVKYGFLSTKRYIIPINKIKGIVLKETILSRIFKYVSVNIICPGITDNKNELKVILPMIKKKNVNNLIAKILYDSKYEIGSKYIYQPIISIKSIIFYTVILNIIVLPIFIYYKIISIYILLFLIVCIFFAIGAYHFKKIQIYDTYFIIITGVFVKKKVIIKYNDVKYFKIKKDPILSKYGINILNVYITSGIKNRRHSLGYVKYSDAINILGNIFEKYILR